MTSKGTEVELGDESILIWFCRRNTLIVCNAELLGLQESVELLSGVAELDSEQVPPVMLEIAQRKSAHHVCIVLDVDGFVVHSLWPSA